jgi:penicillin amidase
MRREKHGGERSWIVRGIETGSRLRGWAGSTRLGFPEGELFLVRTILRLLLWIAGVVVVIVATAIWWYVYRPLPQLDGSVSLPGLMSEVSVERDNWGVPHIRAGSVEDLAEAQGYVMAQDRLWQMDLLRRAARGQLSEVLGPATLEIDKDFRTCLSNLRC